MKRIPYVNLAAQWDDESAELLPLVEQALASGAYVGGESIERFESAVAEYCGTRFAIALNSGTDALVCALHALGIGKGDEVITAPNSFIASAAAIIHVGATPVFVDVKPDQNLDPNIIEAALTKKARAIMPIHLTGRVADMDAINDIAARKNLYVIEDAAQAIGSMWRGAKSGSLGNIGCFSAHPLKNLNACGDAGFVTTDDRSVALKIQRMRNHGMADRNNVEAFGMVSRMDALQATILNFRLSRLPKVIEARRKNAALYLSRLNPDCVFAPPEQESEFNTYHTFVVQVDGRDDLRRELLARGIETAVHYPVPIHLQPAGHVLPYRAGDFPETEKQAKRILTLPVNQYLQKTDIGYVADSLNNLLG
jgi:dTDP-4-amino-4,6-dideoxygalactose transaminase